MPPVMQVTDKDYHIKLYNKNTSCYMKYCYPQIFQVYENTLYTLLLVKLLLCLPFLVIRINTPSQHTANWGKIKKIIITTICSKVFSSRLYLFRKSEGKEPPLTFVQLFTYSIIYALWTTRKTVIIRLLLLVEIANLYWF